MKIVARYDFNGGIKFINENYSSELNEIQQVINQINATKYKNKISEEKTMPGQMLYSPKELNNAFKEEFIKTSWTHHKVECDYIYGEYFEGYIKSNESNVRPFRDMDFLVVSS